MSITHTWPFPFTRAATITGPATSTTTTTITSNVLEPHGGKKAKRRRARRRSKPTRAEWRAPISLSGNRTRAPAMTVLRKSRVDVALLRQFVKKSPELAAVLDEVLSAPPPRGRLG